MDLCNNSQISNIDRFVSKYGGLKCPQCNVVVMYAFAPAHRLQLGIWNQASNSERELIVYMVARRDGFKLTFWRRRNEGRGSTRAHQTFLCEGYYEYRQRHE